MHTNIRHVPERIQMVTIAGLADETTRMGAPLSLVSIPVVTIRKSAPPGPVSLTTPITMATTPLIVVTPRIIAGTTLSLGPVVLLAILDHPEIAGLRATKLVRPVDSASSRPSLEFQTEDPHLMSAPGHRRTVDLETVHGDTTTRMHDLHSHPFPSPGKEHERRSHQGFDADLAFLPT